MTQPHTADPIDYRANIEVDFANFAPVAGTVLAAGLSARPGTVGG